jgi:hypothetical protein
LRLAVARDFPIGSTHRWWNDGDKELVLQGVATPAVDLDRYLQALFEVINAGPERRPPMFYMAHVLHRHRHTQLALVIPRPVQRVLFPIIIFLGQCSANTVGLTGRVAQPDAPVRRCQIHERESDSSFRVVRVVRG